MSHYETYTKTVYVQYILLQFAQHTKLLKTDAQLVLIGHVSGVSLVHGTTTFYNPPLEIDYEIINQHVYFSVVFPLIRFL